MSVIGKSKRKNFGFTLLEVCLAVTFLGFLFTAAFGVMRYTRTESEKGFWIQKSITQLRNTTRAITSLLKKTSYPSTIVKLSGSSEKVFSYKEMRQYDRTGRLRNILVNDSTNFDMHAMISGSGAIVPDTLDQRILYFPICTPEIDASSGYEEGTIRWIELLLKPCKDYRYTGLGDIYLIERSDSYNTKSRTNRAFGMGKKFSDKLSIKTNKLLVSDVREVEIDSYSVEELRGVFFKAGERVERKRKRILTSISINTSHPKDKKIWLGDQCSIINNVGLVKVTPDVIIELVSVNWNGSSANSTAVVSYNGQTKSGLSPGKTFGKYIVTHIYPDAVAIKEAGTEVEKFLTKK